MEIDLASYFKKSNTIQYHDFIKACESYNGKITDDGACKLEDKGAKVLIRDWRDNSIERPDHDLHGIFARNDLFFLCYAQNTHVEIRSNLNTHPTNELFEDVHKRWLEAVGDESIFPDWLVHRDDWRLSVSNYGYAISARKKKCNEAEELRMSGLVDEVMLGHRSITDLMMDEIMRKKND